MPTSVLDGCRLNMVLPNKPSRFLYFSTVSEHPPTFFKWVLFYVHNKGKNR